MEKVIKRIIVVIIVIILLIGVSYIILNKLLPGNKKERDRLADNQKDQEEWYENPTYLTKGQMPKKTRNASVFFTADACIKKYLQNEIDIEEGQYITKTVYDLSGMQYVTYFIKSKLNGEDSFYILNTDIENQTFSVTPIDEDEFNEKIYEPVKEDQKKEEKIQPNDDNKLVTVTMHDEDICRKYLRYYNDLLLNDPEEAYEILDSEYKRERFKDFDEFKKYIEDNKSIIEQASLSGYSINPEEEKTKYTLKNSFNNYYIIDENSIMDFTIKLDAYTVKDENFMDRYKSLKEAEKTSADIGFFIQMINNKDYRHAYEKLSNGFKNNYFKTQEEFENYIKNNWYSINNYEIDNSNNEGNVYIYRILLTNARALREETTIEKTINIRLDSEDDTNYEISFNVN